jgi:hypothetical protein
MVNPPIDIVLEPTYNPNVPSIGYVTYAEIEVLKLLAPYYTRDQQTSGNYDIIQGHLDFYQGELLNYREMYRKALDEGRVYYVTEDDAKNLLYWRYYGVVRQLTNNGFPPPPNVEEWTRRFFYYQDFYIAIRNRASSSIDGGNPVVLEYNPLMAH